MTGLTLCPVEDVDAKTVDDICLPPAVWKVLDEAAAKAGMDRAGAIAQIIMERIRPTAPATATRRAKK